MSWIQVDFSLVRYSPVEGTHYFYDPAYPSTIQFLVSGQWESWDVGWVKYKAQDPEVRRIAEDAEARLIHDPSFGYRQWPSAPPADTNGDGRGPSQSSIDSPLPSPTSGGPSASSPRDYLHSQPQVPPSASQLGYTTASSATQPPSYTSPYAPPPPTISSPTRLPTAISEAQQPSPPATDVSNPGPSNGLQPYTYPPLGPPIRPAAAVPRVVVSRNRETKILLSLDGDGIRGLSAILIVESLVNAVCVKIGQQIDPYQIFDLMGGVSTGGVIAIMLGRLRMQPHRAREAYKLIAKQMFQNKRDFFISLDPHVPTLHYDGQSLENEIKNIIIQETGNQDELLLDPRDDSADVFVVSTHIDIGTNKAALMRSYQTRRIAGPELDDNMTVWQAMRATSIAPRYMQRDGITRRPIIEPGLVDHGTAKNNPIRDILYECRKLYRYTNDMMVMISIGPGSGFDRMMEISEMANSVEDRNAEAKVTQDKFEFDHLALMERGWMRYFRFNVPDLDSVPLEEWCHEEQIREKTLAYLGRPDIGQMFYDCVDAITTILLGGQHAR